ncbi:N-acetylmuramoyl-L-alanine amidase [Streptomyces cavourensis]|nr:N-acetylmuramoyl-L-alanine amidase [Streptomyces cavourensis]
MLNINEQGEVIHPRIKQARSFALEHGKLDKVNGIIVHQTGAPTASSTFNSYRRTNAAGAHFLIDRDGTIYQTASVYKRTWHVGTIRARCLIKHSCSPAELKTYHDLMRKPGGPAAISRLEALKDTPERFPSNVDSIGIELVGDATPHNTHDDKLIRYETVTVEQNRSLTWLVGELKSSMGVPVPEVFRHPDVSYKNSHEAESARW